LRHKVNASAFGVKHIFLALPLKIDVSLVFDAKTIVFRVIHRFLVTESDDHATFGGCAAIDALTEAKGLRTNLMRRINFALNRNNESAFI